jgi:hypothetical protein
MPPPPAVWLEIPLQQAGQARWGMLLLEMKALSN